MFAVSPSGLLYKKVKIDITCEERDEEYCPGSGSTYVYKPVENAPRMLADGTTQFINNNCDDKNRLFLTEDYRIYDLKDDIYLDHGKMRFSQLAEFRIHRTSGGCYYVLTMEGGLYLNGKELIIEGASHIGSSDNRLIVNKGDEWYYIYVGHFCAGNTQLTPIIKNIPQGRVIRIRDKIVITESGHYVITSRGIIKIEVEGLILAGVEHGDIVAVADTGDIYVGNYSNKRITYHKNRNSLFGLIHGVDPWTQLLTVDPDNYILTTISGKAFQYNDGLEEIHDVYPPELLALPIRRMKSSATKI